MMLMLLPEAIQNSPCSPSSMMAVTSASSIEGLLTTTMVPSGFSPSNLPSVPEESPMSTIDEPGALSRSPGQALIEAPEPASAKSERGVSERNSKTSVSYA